MLEDPTSVLLGAGAAVIASLVAARVVRRFWPKTGNWGINPTRPACPFCQSPSPRIRKPANRRQFLWGGWTCAQCGRELDKYGQPVVNKKSDP
jgi:hypothetical protein